MELSAAQRERYERNLLVEGFTDRMQQAIQIAARYSGETALCFYLTDQKKMIQPKQKQSIAISAESEQAFSAIFTSSELGILQV